MSLYVCFFNTVVKIKRKKKINALVTIPIRLSTVSSSLAEASSRIKGEVSSCKAESRETVTKGALSWLPMSSSAKGVTSRLAVESTERA